MSGFVAVVGTVNLDSIVTADGARYESLGGILYNCVVLGHLLEGTGIRVRLCARLGAEHREEAARLLADVPAVDPSGLIADTGGTNVSHLDYSQGPERVEWVESRVPPLVPKDLAGIESARAILVNMISGRDLTPATVRVFRECSSALFLLDVQALVRSEDKPRRTRAVVGWQEWCPLFDVVRGNTLEIKYLCDSPDSFSEALRRILEAGAGEVLATRGAAGSLRATLEEERVDGERSQGGRQRDGRLRIEEIPAVRCKRPLDPTGCGDAYLAGVCAARVLGLAPDVAPHLGSYVASRVVALRGLAELAALRGIREEAAAADPRFAALAKVSESARQARPSRSRAGRKGTDD
jgi:sugar/nucleoside kinase (ribokinase family)